MGIGARVRRLLGPYERTVAGAYRRLFVDLDAFAEILGRHVPRATRILEIGCGEGQMTERLVRLYPEAEIHAIDLIPAPGRLYRGDRGRVRFSTLALESIADQEPQSFDLVVLVDVLHHVPMESRSAFLATAGRMINSTGTFVFKEWAKLPAIGYWIGYAADRFITGDDVHYHTEPELLHLARTLFDRSELIVAWHIPPCKSNTCMLVRRAD